MSEPTKPAGDQGKAPATLGGGLAWQVSGEQTLLGVAPPIALPPLPATEEPPPPPPAPAPPQRAASSGAIAGARMISVSDAPASPAAVAKPPPAAIPTPAPDRPDQDAPRAVSVPPQPLPARPASIGGWQSAGPAVAFQAPSLIETITSMRSPLADVPPEIIEAAPTVPDAPPIFDEQPPSPVAQGAGTEPQLPEPAAAAAVAGAAVGGWQPVMHTVPIPIARTSSAPPSPPVPPEPPSPSPETFATTALSDDYLRAARDVVRAERAAAAAPAVAPASPAGEALANAATLQFESVAPVRAPLHEQPPSTTSLPISVHMDTGWRRPEGYTPTMPLNVTSTRFPSWRVLLLVGISVLALIAIAAAAFVAVRRFAAPAGETSDARRVFPSRIERTLAASEARALTNDDSAANASSDAAELGARAARLVLLGRHDAAQPLYAELARRSPAEPAYAALERILARARGAAR